MPINYSLQGECWKGNWLRNCRLIFGVLGECRSLYIFSDLLFCSQCSYIFIQFTGLRYKENEIPIMHVVFINTITFTTITDISRPSEAHSDRGRTCYGAGAARQVSRIMSFLQYGSGKKCFIEPSILELHNFQAKTCQAYWWRVF